jgi:hypothetical protein
MTFRNGEAITELKSTHMKLRSGVRSTQRVATPDGTGRWMGGYMVRMVVTPISLGFLYVFGWLSITTYFTFSQAGPHPFDVAFLRCRAAMESQASSTGDTGVLPMPMTVTSSSNGLCQCCQIGRL